MWIKQLLACTAVMLLTAFAFGIQAQPIAPVSGLGTISASGSGGSYLPVFSEDGSHIAFLSHANNLVTNDDSGLTLDVFLANVSSGAMELISVNTNGSGGGNGDSMHISVTRDARLVVFASRASNLTTNDTNNAVDVFYNNRYEWGTPRTFLISAGVSGHSPAEPIPFAPRALSTTPQIGDPLGYVVFASAATNLVSGRQHTNGAYDVFVSEGPGWIRLVSRANIGTTPHGSSHSPQIAGFSVAFISTATNLFLQPPGVINFNRGGDIYVRHLMEERAYWVSQNTRDFLVGAFPAPPSSYTCFNYALSGFGQAVVYQATADPYSSSSSNVLLYCQVGWTNPVLIATDSDLVGRPQISREGDFVAFSSRSNVYLWSRLTGSNTLVSVSTNGLPGNGPSHSPVMDPRGNYIAYVSRASDLVPGGGPSNRFQIYVYNRSNRTNYLLTRNTNGIASMGDFESSHISLAPDIPGRIAFDSTAPDLVPNDFNGTSDIFMNIGSTRLISRAHAARAARTIAPMSGATPNSVSADGRVAFTSFDNPFIPDDTNIWQDVLVRDLMSGGIQRLTAEPPPWPGIPQAAIEPVVSAAGDHVVYSLVRGPTSGGAGDRHIFWYNLLTGSNVLVSPAVAGGLPFSSGASVSSNGTFVVFQSTVPASVFVTNRSDGNGGYDVFARDMISGERQLISVDYTGTRSGNRPSTNAVLSPDGRWIAFESTATDLLPVNVTGGIRSLFVRDLLSNRTEVGSVDSAGSAQWGSRSGAAFSGNSRYVMFVVLLGDNRHIFRRDLELKTSSLVATAGENPSLNWDGRFIAYEMVPFQGMQQIYVTDMQSGIAKLVSANLSGMPGNRNSTRPLITPDGRFIVFTSLASDLVQNDNNNAADIFVADRILGSVLLLTINSAGTASANGASSKPTLSANGRTVIFQSLASDLIAGDYNDRRDVFVATLSMPDSDGDGMDDDFEITYFGNLEHSGAGDMDQDGHTDYQEFLAGTNPTSDTSILRAITITSPSTQARHVIWNAVPGRSYAVQYKDRLNDPWSTLVGIVRATASTAVKHDCCGLAQRLYRVVLAE